MLGAYTTFFPVALLETEAGEGEPGKMQLQFFM